MATTKVNLFTKSMKTEDGKEFDTYFIVIPSVNLTMSANLTNECKAQILVSKCDFPLEIELEDKKDYFITNETWEDNDGVAHAKDKIVIRSFTSISHLELESKTLGDVIAEQVKGIE